MNIDSSIIVPLFIFAIAMAGIALPLHLAHMRREMGMFIALAAVCLVLHASNPNFFGQLNLLSLTRQVAMLGIFSIGMAFVIITGGIDLSIGSVIGLTGVIIAKIVVERASGGGSATSAWLGVGAALLAAVAIGFAQGALITRLNLQPFIVTLGSMLLLRGFSQTIAEGGTLAFGASPFARFANGSLLDALPAGISDALAKASGDIGVLHLNMLNIAQLVLAYPMLIFLGVSLLCFYLLHQTVFGRYLYAIGGNRDAAAYSGVAVKNVEMYAYALCAGLGGLAGVCYASYIGQMSHMVGQGYELDAIAAAVLGGCSLRGGEGTVIGVIIGAAMMRVIYNGMTMFQWIYADAAGRLHIWNLNTNWNYIVIGLVILIAIVLDQLVHLSQERRRKRRAGANAPPKETPNAGAAPPMMGGSPPM